jgi:phage gpG-like protein
MATGNRFVSVTFNDRAVRRALLGMDKARKSIRKVMRDLREPLRDDLKAHADKERGPDGKWPGRSAKTEQRDRKRTTVYREKRRRGRSGPLQETRSPRKAIALLGKLPEITVSRTRLATLIASNAVPWSGVHNEGGTVGHGSVIPQREFVFLSDPFLGIAAEKITEFVHGGWRKGA